MIWALLGWAACSVLTWLLLQHMWRWKYDLERRDAAFFAVFSLLGPISLAASIFVTTVEWSMKGESPVIWKRHDPR